MKKSDTFHHQSGPCRRKGLWILLIILLILLLAAAAGLHMLKIRESKEPTLEEIVSKKISAYETDLKDSLASMETNDDVAAYLLNWASSKKIDAVRDASGNVIFHVASTLKKDTAVDPDAAKLDGPVILVCEYDAAAMQDHVSSMAVAMTAARNPIRNEEFRVIFCPRQQGLPAGAAQLDAAYFTEDTQVICIGRSGTSKVSTTTAGYRHLLLSDQLTYEENHHDKAYKISVTGLPSETPDNRMTDANPIKILGDLMANLKSNSFVFDLTGFRGGNAANLTPSSATMTIVINDSDEDRLIQRLNKAIENFEEKYTEDYPEASYTYQEVENPKRILAHTHTENLLSLLYTASDGIYYKDNDGNAVALSNIGRVRTKGGVLTAEIVISSYSGDYLEEMTEAYRTIAGLCDVDFEILRESPIYSGGGASSALLTAFATACETFTDDKQLPVKNTVETAPCQLLAEKREGLPILWLAITENSKETFAGSIIEYLDVGKDTFF